MCYNASKMDLLNYLKDEKGQTLTEYILLLALVAVGPLAELTAGIFGVGSILVTGENPPGP